MAFGIPPNRFVCLSLLICINTVCVGGHPGPERPVPNAEQSRFAVCGLDVGRGRALRKHVSEGDDNDEPAASLDTGRIVGGREAKQNELHYIVSVQVGGGTHFRTVHKCGGAIYSAKWIITAAHCFGKAHQPRFEKYQVVAGEHQLYVPEDGEQTVRVKRIIEHPLYDPENTDHNDIALMELEKPLRFNRNVRPLKLPACDYVPKGKATISGWGQMTVTSISDAQQGATTFAGSLHVAEIDIYSQKQCQEAIAEGLEREEGVTDFELHENSFCAGKMDGGVDACQGDSGGPLVCHDKYGEVLCGIVSLGYGCALKDLPGLYTYVPHFRDWIVHVTSGA